MTEKTDRVCPKCYSAGLIFSDDIEEESWSNSGARWDCPTCGYNANDHTLECDEYAEDEYDEWENEE